jgi:DNA-binding NarL/FixJ family response regulator
MVRRGSTVRVRQRASIIWRALQREGRAQSPSVGGTHGRGRRSRRNGTVARELQLARLVVDQKTNSQIAAELFLSLKTVETHLRNIFRKLGVANRVELARAVEQADRAESAAPR